MDGTSYDVEVLGGQRGTKTSRVLVHNDKYEVKELRVTQAKVVWIWEEMRKYKTLFTDFDRYDVMKFGSLIEDQWTYWLEVVDSANNIVGIIYITDLDKYVDANISIVFFDRRPAEKLALVKATIEVVFDRFPSLHRLTLSVPSIYHATIRLAKKLGFTREGTKRQSILMGSRWIDEEIYGILASETVYGNPK